LESNNIHEPELIDPGKARFRSAPA
jgi:hypothetical protein